MNKILPVIAGIVLICLVTYGGYWIAKHVSYSIFYEDMVIETINEQVKESALKLKG